MNAAALRDCIIDAFGPCVKETPSKEETEAMLRLRSEKYESDAWNRRR